MNYIKKPLKEYVNMQKLTGKTDLEIICDYIIDNDIELECVDLINRLLKAQIHKRDSILARSRSWLPTLFKNVGINAKNVGNRKSTTREEQDFYNLLTARYLLDMDLLEGEIETAKQIIPNRNMPMCIFTDMLKWLDKKYGIRFKDYKGE